jgi:hypothetical protein
MILSSAHQYIPAPSTMTTKTRCPTVSNPRSPYHDVTYVHTNHEPADTGGPHGCYLSVATNQTIGNQADRLEVRAARKFSEYETQGDKRHTPASD